MRKKIDLISLIPFGHENAVTRERLQHALGVSDRVVRKEIERLRLNGQPIANLQDGSGYFIPITREEIQAQRNLNRSRALHILMQNKYLDRLERSLGQMEIGGWEDGN